VGEQRATQPFHDSTTADGQNDHLYSLGELMLKLLLVASVSLASQGYSLPGESLLSNPTIRDLVEAYSEITKTTYKTHLPSENKFLFDAFQRGKLMYSKRFQHLYKGLHVMGLKPFIILVSMVRPRSVTSLLSSILKPLQLSLQKKP